MARLDTAIGLLMAMGVAACGGGGGGSPETGSNPPPPNDPSPNLSAGGSPASFRTSEFQFNPGLGQIGAEHAYARGLQGEGGTIAVIDGTVNPDSPELKPNIHPATRTSTDESCGIRA